MSRSLGPRNIPGEGMSVFTIRADEVVQSLHERLLDADMLQSCNTVIVHM